MRRKTYPIAISSNTNLTWTDLGSDPGLRVERPATNHLKQGTVFGAWNVPEIYLNFQFLPEGKHSVKIVRTNQLSLRSEVIGVYCELHTKYVGTQCDKVQFV
jgi:hypothetical protein